LNGKNWVPDVGLDWLVTGIWVGRSRAATEIEVRKKKLDGSRPSHLITRASLMAFIVQGIKFNVINGMNIIALSGAKRQRNVANLQLHAAFSRPFELHIFEGFFERHYS
jgi:hypothetical protein